MLVREYKASLDKLSVGITIFVFLLFGGILSVSLYHRTNSTDPIWPIGLMGLFFVLMLVVTYLLHPVKYTLRKEKLTIHRPFSDVVVRTDDIRSVTAVNKKDMRWTARTFGNGGLFGYYGKFWNKKFGNMTWYATKLNNYILIETRNKNRIVLTPDNIQLESEIRKLLTERDSHPE